MDTYVYVVRDNSPSGVYSVYATRAPAVAAVRLLGGNPDCVDPASGAWIVTAGVQTTAPIA